MRSIRRNLLLALLATMAAAMALGAWATYMTAREEANALFDYHLQQIALSLRDQTFQGGAAGDESLDFVIRVWDREGLTIYYSRPHQWLPDLARLGYSTEETPEGEWRIFAVQYHDRTIAVAQPLEVRSRLAADAALRTLTPFLVLLPLLGLLTWMLVDQGLRPLNRLARSVATRTPDALEPLGEDPVPEEARPLVHALNGLLARLKGALEAQRAFIADAAHELRTPLTALQLQVQLVERAQGEAERAGALAELKRGLQRTIHTVQQLLTLARQEPGAAEHPLAPVRLADLARQVVADLSPLAEAKAIDLGVTRADDDASVAGDGEALRILLANLVGNAVRYTPAGGRVDVAAGRDGGRSHLEVCDNGPGIPSADRERVFDRFYRRGGEEESGSGLGLAIVRAIADRHGAQVALGDGMDGGLRVRVEFPP
ncbi:MAG: two-component sensor histidine kinase [Rhodocyclaceae bacterium]|nr:two-component sensor histidine kinase [Rhodocyclaceae bacterium]